jgi:hypothetical protein
MLKFRNVLVAAAALALVSGVAVAQDSTWYFTCQSYHAPGTAGFQPDAGAAFPPAVASQNPILFLEPNMPGTLNNLGSFVTNVGVLRLRVNVADKYPSNAEALSSMGLGVRSAVAFVGANPQGIAAMNVDIFAAGWSDTNVVSVNDDLRAVFVPASLGDFSNGLAPTGASSHNVMDIEVVAANGCRPQEPARYAVFLDVGDLLVTRVVDPAATASPPETIAFGFAGGTPEAATGSGSDAGATSATADAFIDIRYKGDGAGGVGGVPNGIVDAADLSTFFATVAAGPAASRELKFTYDFGGAGDGSPNGLVDAADQGGFLGRIAGFGAVPACSPAPLTAPDGSNNQIGFDEPVDIQPTKKVVGQGQGQQKRK